MTDPQAPDAMHVMVDLETLGTEPFSPILSIGACRFQLTPNIGEPGVADVFYQPITLESCFDVGLKPSASTTLWWMQQSKEAQKVFTDPAAIALPEALDRFTDFLNSRPDEMWGNSARFDFGLLSAAYRACGKEIPWEHWRERCYRTMKTLPMVQHIKLERFGTYHNALDDALSQARHLRAILLHLGA